MNPRSAGMQQRRQVLQAQIAHDRENLRRQLHQWRQTRTLASAAGLGWRLLAGRPWLRTLAAGALAAWTAARLWRAATPDRPGTS